MTQCTFILQIFYDHKSSGNYIIIARKILKDIIITGVSDYVEQFLQALNDRLTLRSIASGAGILLFCSMKFTQIGNQS